MFEQDQVATESTEAEITQQPESNEISEETVEVATTSETNSQEQGDAPAESSVDAPQDSAGEPAAAQPEPAPVAAAPTPAPAPTEEVVDDSNLFDQAMAEMDQMDPRKGSKSASDSYRKLSKGDRIEAKVILVEDTRVFVNLGTKAEGVVPLAELTDDNVDSCKGLVNVGDVITVVVIRPDGGDGNPVVSKKRADFDEAWHRIIRAFNEGTPLKATVIDRVKGGLVVDVGVRGFVPATHVGSGKLRNIEKYVGEILELKVLEVDKERKKVVLSNREAEEVKREEMKNTLFDKAKVGEILEGSVRRIADYGAFVDLGGIDGLLHISEMSWMRINHPKEVLKEGQKINVMVLRIDKDAGKISLGLRQVLPDPWNLIKENYKIGQQLKCVISRMVQSGAFVRLPEGAEAFLPVSEISHRRINKPQDALTEGQEVELTIIDLRPDERRMVLSLKAGQPAEAQIGYGYGFSTPGGEFDSDRGARKPHPGGAKKKKKGGRGGDEFDGGGANRGGGSGGAGGATIGERLGMLKGFHFRSDEDEDATEATEAAEATTETAPESTTDSE